MLPKCSTVETSQSDPKQDRPTKDTFADGENLGSNAGLDSDCKHDNPLTDVGIVPDDDRIDFAPIVSHGAIHPLRERRTNPPGLLITKSDTIATEKSHYSCDSTDHSNQQVFRGRYLLWLAYQSTGVIYGDIGTSPLYVFSSTFTSEPLYDDLLGALSLIIWTLTLMVTLKYVLIVLHADDEGEGGTFAIYSLLSRYANIVRWDPREERKMKKRALAGPKSGIVRLLETSTVIKTALKIVGVFGVSLVMADGILTPAQSVLGAVQGLKVVDESITTPVIVGTSCAILILLFVIQPLGVSKIGSVFAPVVMIWLLFNMSSGVYNLVKMDHTVLKAFSPYFAGQFFVRNKERGWRMLGGILLCFTGVEALFADLGAFSRRAIQLSWLVFAYPCLLLAYIGQAAYIARNPGAYANPFFNSVPPGTFYPALVIAVLAAIVASQTMITATFQLLSQIIKLSYFPQIKVIHTSKKFHNQIYIPWVNWLLMIGTICVTAGYNNTTKLGEAYGVCVILVTFLTTCMVALTALVVWRLSLVLVIPCFLAFALLDGLYLSSALTKIPDGAWLTICLAILLSSVFVLWRFGKENQWEAEASDRISTSDLIVVEQFPENGETGSKTGSVILKMPEHLGGSTITRIRGIGIFFDKTGSYDAAPAVFVHFLQKFQAMPAITVFMTLKPLSIPTVLPEARFSLSRCKSSTSYIPDTYRVIIRHGYADRIVTSELDDLVYENIRNFLIRERTCPVKAEGKLVDGTHPGAPDTRQAKALDADGVHERLNHLDSAYADQIVSIVGKEQMRIGESRGYKGWARRITLAAFLWLRNNTGSRVANMNLNVEKTVEIGFVKIV